MILRGRWRYLLISAAVLAADQVTKAYIAARPDLGYQPYVVIPGLFEIVSWRNPGAMFSLMTDLPDPWRKGLLTLLPVVAVVVIVLLIRRADDRERFALTGFSLVLGGAVGNLIDRIFRGGVVDFLYFGFGYDPARTWLESVFGTHHWPAFNVADSAICVGAAALAVEILRPSRPAGEEGAAAEPATARTARD